MTAAVSDLVNKLYEAGKESIVSNETAASTFEKIAQVGFVSSKVDFLELMKAAEKTIKAEFELKKMPNPWRSAKSVVWTCLTEHIMLQGEDGKMFGKTALQQKIREKKTKSAMTFEQYCNDIVHRVSWNKYGYDPTQVLVRVKGDLNRLS